MRGKMAARSRKRRRTRSEELQRKSKELGISLPEIN